MSRRGLTLVEWLVIVAIFAIVLSILIPSLRKMEQAAKGTDTASGKGQSELDLSNVAVPEARTPEPDTIGLFFCVDVSGSMAKTIEGREKIAIAKDAMAAVLKQIGEYQQAHPGRKIDVGLAQFSGAVTVLQPVQPFDRHAIERVVTELRPSGPTAIGEAIQAALRELLQADYETRAILVMTDGENTTGMEPHEVVNAIKKNANSRQVPTADVEVFLVAFDVSSDLFTPVKNAGATVMESRDAASLKSIMTQLVEEVLLEAE